MGGNTDNADNTGILSIYRHEKYYSSSYDFYNFDIAFLQLDEVVSFTYDIQPICLPQSLSVNYTKKLVTPTGWYNSWHQSTQFLERL